MDKSMDMVILSKSSKYSGYCVAGLELASGRLVRLVSSDTVSHGALFPRDLIMENGRKVEVLDAIRVIGATPSPGIIQTENHIIHPGRPLQFLEKLSIEAVAERYPQPRRKAVFRGGASIIPSKAIDGIGHSLELLYVTDLTVYTIERNGKLRTRADFELESQQMTGFSVTDPEFYGVDGERKSFEAAYILCSLAEDEWASTRGYFKFVASILPTTVKEIHREGKPENAGKPWSQEDDCLLLKMYEAGSTVEEIASHFKRTEGSIGYRLVMYGMAGDDLVSSDKLAGMRPISNDELKERLLHGESIAQLAERYGRAEKAIRLRLFYMGFGGKGPELIPLRKAEKQEVLPKPPLPPKPEEHRAVPDTTSPRKAASPQGRQPHIVVTAFEPFDGAAVNASWEAVRRLEGVDKALLPVSFRRVRKAIRMILESRPDAVICVGEARGRIAVSVERVAINLMDARIADNDGAQPRDEAIVPDSPAAFLATLPTRRIVEDIRRAGIPAELSYSAGTYVCNCAFYTLMHTIAAAGLPTLGGFIHVPSRGSSAQELAGGLEHAIRAVRTVLSEPE